MQSVFSLHLFFFFGHTDGKCMTHRTSVWLPERVGLGSALSEARRGPWAWSQWVTNPLTANVITCDWETPLSKSTTSPPLSSSSSNKGRQRVKQHIAFLSAERTGHMWKEEKKKPLWDVYRANDAAQTALTTECKSVWHKMHLKATGLLLLCFL